MERPAFARLLLAAALAAFVAAALFVVALFAAAASAPITGAYALLLLAAAVAARGPLQRQVGPRAPAAALLAAASVSPFVHLAGRMALNDDPITWTHFRCGTGMAAAIILAPFVLFALVLPLCLGAFLVVASRERRIVERTMAALAWLATGGSLLLVAFAGLHARRPEGRQWLQTVPIVGTLERADFKPIVLPPPPREPDVAPKEDATRTTDAATFHGVTFVRICFGATPSCTLGLLGRDGRVANAGVSLSDGAIVVQRDPARGLWFIGGSALDDTGRARDVTLDMVGHEVRAPRGWIVVATIGLAIALFALSRAHRRAVVDALLDGAVEGEVIALSDGTRWPLPVAAAWPNGALVVARMEDAMTSFRGGATPSFSLGSTADRASLARARNAWWSALALASALLTTAPLLACWALGIGY